MSVCEHCGATWEPDIQLTKRQSEILLWIRRYVGRTGHSPTYREIADSFGLNSLATVWEHVENLEAKGVLRRTGEDGRHRQACHLQVRTGRGAWKPARRGPSTKKEAA